MNGGTYTASYDPDGNMLTWDGSAITWRPANLPASIAGALGSSTFNYDPDGARYYQSATTTATNVTLNTTYIGALFEVVYNPGTNVGEYRHNIVADGQVIAIHTISTSGAASTDYLHYDHLGSVNAITDATGAIIQQTSFDSFGQRRIATNWDYGVSQATLATLKDDTDRGYTGEEQLDNLSLVDLNGRVYDPTVGRFISADPTGGSGTSRYTYVADNPLEFTDPTGFCILHCFWQPKQAVKLVGDAADDLLQGIGHAGQEVWNYAPEIAAVVAAYYTGGAASGLFGTGFWGTVGTGAAAGGAFSATDTTLRGGNGSQIFDNGLRGAAIGGVGGGLLYGANEVTAYSGNNFGVGLVSHGVAGGLTSVAAGGSFNRGFEFGGLAYSAYWGYQQMVGQAPRWTSGQGTTPKSADYPPWDESQDVNNFGAAVCAQCSGGFFSEGGAFSDAMNAYPGMNALATLHDVWADSFTLSVFSSNPALYYWVLDVPTMPLAAAITYGGLVNTSVGYGIMAGHEESGGGS